MAWFHGGSSCGTGELGTGSVIHESHLAIFESSQGRIQQLAGSGRTVSTQPKATLAGESG